MNKRIGFTTSFPVEVVFAAGHFPVDLNNIFLTQNAAENIRQAELRGFPRTICSWIKGNFSAALMSDLDEVIGVVQGDCSNGNSLLDMLSEEGMPVYRFSFPYDHAYSDLNNEINMLEKHFGVQREQTQQVKVRLDKIRTKLLHLDYLTWKQRLVSGLENHWWQVNSSDFMGDPDEFERLLDIFLVKAEKRTPLPTRLRLAYLGVPPIYNNIYQAIAELGGDVLFNEVQRQFAMPGLEKDIVRQYLVYTYPYGVHDRLSDILPQLEERSIEGIISYTQSFCHLQIDNIILKKHIALPFLTLEGDQPEALDARTLLRLESFFEVHAQ